MIYTSCGHAVKDYHQTVNACIKGHDRQGERHLVYGTYCKHCYQNYVKEGEVLESREEEMNWLFGDNND